MATMDKEGRIIPDIGYKPERKLLEGGPFLGQQWQQDNWIKAINNLADAIRELAKK